MYDDSDDLDGYGHEELLQALVRHLLSGDDLADLCAYADIPILVDTAGQPVRVTSARSYADAGVLTHDRGVLVRFSDGSAFGLTVTVNRRPTEEITVRHH